MADTPQTLALTILAQEYRGDIVRQTNRETQAIKHVLIKPGSGLNSPFVFEGDGQNAEYYAEGADVANMTADAQIKGTLAWGLVRANLHVTQLAMDAARSSSSPLGNVRLWVREVVNSGAKLAKLINQQIFVGDGYDGTTQHLAGLETLIGSATANVGGVDRSSGGNSLYRPSVFDPGSPTAITLTQIRKDLAAIRILSGMQPDLAIVSPNVYVQIVSLFEATRRYIQDIKQSADGIELDSSYQVVEVDGCRFVSDPDAVESTIYYMQTMFWELEYLPPDESLDIGGARMAAVNGIPLLMRFKWLADTGQSKKASSDITIQQQIRRPNAFGVRRNVQVS
jgi:hypothetical protein